MLNQAIDAVANAAGELKQVEYDSAASVGRLFPAGIKSTNIFALIMNELGDL